MPPLLKKWLDDVLTYGFAYGSTGESLRGKDLQVIVSVGGQSGGTFRKPEIHPAVGDVATHSGAGRVGRRALSVLTV